MKLHLRAADWYEANGSPAMALEHLLNTDERDRCVQLVTALTLPTYAAGQMSTVQRWLSALGDDAIEGYPPLAVLGRLGRGDDRADGRRPAMGGDRRCRFVRPGPGGRHAHRSTPRGRCSAAAMCPAGPEQAMTDATFAVAQEPPWSPWRDQALCLAGEAHLLTGETERAEAAFAESSAVSPGTGNSDAFVISESELAFLAMDRGRWDDAADHLERALAAIDERSDARLRDERARVRRRRTSRAASRRPRCRQPASHAGDAGPSDAARSCCPRSRSVCDCTSRRCAGRSATTRPLGT